MAIVSRSSSLSVEDRPGTTPGTPLVTPLSTECFLDRPPLAPKMFETFSYKIV